ncbi:hypothetical protein LR003_03275 [candidate division NPL-UPA2 bacterium]|nr:hypothetical protein [candidate division NPL-UPA2 bacterium]
MKGLDWLKDLSQKIKSLFSDGFLCDTCKYDWGNVCYRRERPNAIRCPDYKKK